MRHYKSLAFKYTGLIDNFLNDHPGYSPIAITYNSDEKLYHLLYTEAAQQPVDAVAFGIWLSKNYIAAVEDGYIGLKDKQHHTTTDLYALFTARHQTPKPGSHE